MQQVVQQSLLSEHQRIVSCTDPSSVSASMLKKNDPAFISQSHWLESPPLEQADTALRCLLGQISRNTNDIYSLVKRIYFLKALNKQDTNTHLASAIYDLFLRLQSLGQPLKERILRTTQKQLSAEELDYFNQCINRPPPTPAPESMLCNSLFHNGLWGETKLISRNISSTPDRPTITPLEEARELINHGDIETAMHILEEQLIKSPHDRAISEELYLIYQHMRDHTHIRRMINILADEHVDYIDAWLALEKEHKQETATL